MNDFDNIFPYMLQIIPSLISNGGNVSSFKLAIDHDDKDKTKISMDLVIDTKQTHDPDMSNPIRKHMIELSKKDRDIEYIINFLHKIESMDIEESVKPFKIKF